MSKYPIKLVDITNWFESHREEALSHGILIVEIRQSNNEYKPSAFADYDSKLFMGRIIVWVSGEVDFELVRLKDGAFEFHHEDVCDMYEPRLGIAFSAFVRKMSGA